MSAPINRTRAVAAMKPYLIVLSSLFACMSAVSLADTTLPLELRFCPQTHIRAYPAESLRGVQSLLLQNAVVVNRGSAAIAISAVDIELLEGNTAVDVRHISDEDLARAAKAGAAVQASGMLEVAAFQFCGKALVPDGIKLAGPVLEPRQALLVAAQPFVYKGRRDALRVRVRASVDATSIETDATLPVVTGFAVTRFMLPVQGSWFVAVGPTFHTGHRWALPEEFGFDLVQLGADTSTHRGSGARLTDYYAYGKPVRAAAAGRVRAVVNDVREDAAVLRRPGEGDEAYAERVRQLQDALLTKSVDAAAGNYVVIEHGHDEYSLYAHLQAGSVSVRAGDQVAAGQAIGRVGSSGNSTEPHLHFQVCDLPGPLACAGIPVSFDGIRMPYADYPRALQSGDIIYAQ